MCQREFRFQNTLSTFPNISKWNIVQLRYKTTFPSIFYSKINTSETVPSMIEDSELIRSFIAWIEGSHL